MLKPKLLIPLTVQFSVRYVLRTGLLNKIQEYADPIIFLGWRDSYLENELRSSGINVYFTPEKQIGVQYERLSKQLINWHLKRINTPTTAIDRRRDRYLSPPLIRFKRSLRDTFFRTLMSFPPYVQFLLEKQQQMVWSDTNLSEYFQSIQQIGPDLVFCLTPYFLEEELLLRAASKVKVPMCTAILSFDNLTTRGLIPIPFDEYYLWNQHNEQELRRIYPETTNKIVKIVGAPQFDFYYDNSYIWNERDWREILGLPLDRPVILFGSASQIIAPQEEQWIIHLDQAIEKNHIKNRPVILLRRHPNEDMSRWGKIKSMLKNVYIDEPWTAGKEKLGKTNITRRDIEKLVSTLYHSEVHINASSTMTVDGAIFDRPQIGPAYDEEGKTDRLAREIYLREHYLPITRSGGLEIVYSREEMITAVNSAFIDPTKFSAGRKKLVQEICTFNDGLSTERVNDALKSFVLKMAKI